MELLKYFDDISNKLNNSEIEEWKSHGKKIVGTLCSNIPEEVIHAAGFLPIRLRAPGLEETSKADAHLHRINCSYSRSILEHLLTGELDFLDGLIATNTCDHHLRLAGEVQDKAGFPVHYFQMYHTQTKGAKEWLIKELEQMMDYIKDSFGTHISEEDLNNSINVYNRTRSLMEKINESRKNEPPLISGTEYMKIVLTGMSIPREKFNDRLESLLQNLDGQESTEVVKPRLLVIGGACDSYKFINFIETNGASVVADGLCFGLRHYQGLIDNNSKDPLSAITDRYFDRASCPSVMDGFDHAYEIINEIIKDLKIHGIICAKLKFCDHWAGSCKMFRDTLRENNDIPLLEIEREYNTTESGQIGTRLQAFLEMMEN